jgi:hypothetical protein
VIELILPVTPLKSFAELDCGSSNCPTTMRLNLTGDLEDGLEFWGFTNPPKLIMLALGGSAESGFRPRVKKSNEYSPYIEIEGVSVAFFSEQEMRDAASKIDRSIRTEHLFVYGNYIYVHMDKYIRFANDLVF